MSRAAWCGVLVFGMVGCVVPAERVPLAPLTEESPPQTYGDLLSRARIQATAATEAFYVNGWADLEQRAKGLEQTARFLPKATDVPAQQKDKVADAAKDLEKDAHQLADAAKTQNAKLTTEIMQRINLKVRELRAEK